MVLADGGGGAATTPSLGPGDKCGGCEDTAAGGQIPSDRPVPSLPQQVAGEAAQGAATVLQFGEGAVATTVNCLLPFSGGQCHDNTGALTHAVAHPGELGSSIEQFAFGTTNVDFTPHGGGLGYGGVVEFNPGAPVRASLSISGDAGVTRDSRGNWNFFGATSVGGFIQVDNPMDPHGPPLKASFPGTPNATPAHDPQEAWGAFIGVGPHAFVTNALSPYDLKGPFTQYSANGGAIDAAGIQANLGQSNGRGIYHAAFFPGLRARRARSWGLRSRV